MKSENKILELSFDFAIQVIEEANAAQTKKDFVSKMSIASKEARETRYWLRLLDRSQLVKLDYLPYLESIEHIINILTKIVKTSEGTLAAKSFNI